MLKKNRELATGPNLLHKHATFETLYADIVQNCLDHCDNSNQRKLNTVMLVSDIVFVEDLTGNLSVTYDLPKKLPFQSSS